MTPNERLNVEYPMDTEDTQDIGGTNNTANTKESQDCQYSKDIIINELLCQFWVSFIASLFANALCWLIPQMLT